MSDMESRAEDVRRERRPYRTRCNVTRCRCGHGWAMHQTEDGECYNCDCEVYEP